MILLGRWSVRIWKIVYKVKQIYLSQPVLITKSEILCSLFLIKSISIMMILMFLDADLDSFQEKKNIVQIIQKCP